MTPSDVARIEVWSRWVGFSAPVRTARVTIRRDGDRFVREQAPAGPPDRVPAAAVGELLAALAAPSVPELDPARFDVPRSALDWHYGSVWTNDYPSILVRVTFADGRPAELRSESQHAFMIPFRVTGPAGGSAAETYDPRVGRAVAGLLPDDHHEKDRLLDRTGALAAAREEAARFAAEPPPELPPVPPPDPANQEKTERAILDILFGNETPEQRAEAEQSGNISRRLLKRVSADDVRDLLARGADPGVADDVGQTALMHAAFPPFDREKFRLLAAAGADVEARRNDGVTGLHIACAGGESAAAAEWVRAGADVNARTTDGRATPLMLGARWPAIVETLLAAGADPDAADDDGHTPLAYAVIEQCWVNGEDELTAMRRVLAAGADANRRDRDGVTPLGHARRVLAREQLDDEACRALGEGRGRASVAVRMARRVVDLLVSAGGHE